MPCLSLAIIQTAGSHLSSPSGLSSKIVPTFTENWRLGCSRLHWNRFREVRKLTFLPAQVGQVTPFGHRKFTMKSWHTARSENWRIALRSVAGSLFMFPIHRARVDESSILSPKFGGS